MKKNLLLYTVSGILLYSSSSLSHAHNNTIENDTVKLSKNSSFKSQASEKAPYGIHYYLYGPGKYKEYVKFKEKKALKLAKDKQMQAKLAKMSKEEEKLKKLTESQKSDKPSAATLESTVLAHASSTGSGNTKTSTQDSPMERLDEKSETESKILVYNEGTKVFYDVKLQDSFVPVDVWGAGTIVNIIRGSITSDVIGLNASNGGNIDATNITVTAVETGLLLTDSTITLRDSTVNVTGDHEAYGVLFQSNLSALEEESTQSIEDGDNHTLHQNVINKVTLENTKLTVENGIGVNAIFTGGVASLQDSTISADVLLQTGQRNRDRANEKNDERVPILLLTAKNSHLEGRAQTLGKGKAVLNLDDNTKWVLKPSKNPTHYSDDQSDYSSLGIDAQSYSNLSLLNIKNSSIVFEKPQSDHYQVLYIGSHPQQENGFSNAPAVYGAEGNAELYLNSKWSNNTPVNKQKTDRVLINGGVLGTTKVYINLLGKEEKLTNSDSDWKENVTSAPSSTQGISLIQVSGEANKNSFKLASNYMTMKGSPYKYVLTAYEPGKSHASQNMLGGGNNSFWDYRLQNEYVDSNRKVRAVLPQVANYLVMPNTLFSAGYTDANNQSIMVDNMRIAVLDSEKNEKKQGIFLSAYNDRVTLSSNQGPLQYGYDADVNYYALQAGVTLAALESGDITTDFGLLGTYGKVSFTPKGMEGSEQTTLDKWLITGYGGIQHDSGIYVNTFVSYGAVKGEITAPLIRKTTQLDDTKIFSASSTIGQKLATGMKELVFEPQAQIIYQNLLFKTISDAEGFEVDMKNPHQWLVRIGGRLMKTITNLSEGNAFSFYGKLNVLKAFGDESAIKIGDTFHLDSMGSSIEGGVGINARFAQNIALHGGVSYRHKLQKAGGSGTNFFGGISYSF
ncbi:autotransporter outer membrane beta-barrel domain-containing protein [Bartonella sp. B17]